MNRFGFFSKVASLPALMLPLTIGAFRRSGDIAVALEMRGLSTASLHGRTTLTERTGGRKDQVAGAICILVVLGAVLYRILSYVGRQGSI